MDIIFATRKLEKECNSYRLLCKECGDRQASLIRRRLDELRDAEILDVMRTLPRARCHELRGNRKGQLSVDLDHPYRLLFEPTHDPVPLKDDGGLDWGQVTAIRILGVENTHE